MGQYFEVKLILRVCKNATKFLQVACACTWLVEVFVESWVTVSTTWFAAAGPSPRADCTTPTTALRPSARCPSCPARWWQAGKPHPSGPPTLQPHSGQVDTHFSLLILPTRKGLLFLEWAAFIRFELYLRGPKLCQFEALCPPCETIY